MPADAALVRLVRQALADVGDPGKADQMQAYMKSEMPFRGIQSPVLKATLRPLLAAHPLPDEGLWQATVRELWDRAEYREERYAALAIARHRHHREHQQPHTLDLYEHLVRSGAWWDLVDETATHLVRDLLLAHPEQLRPVLEEWAVSDDLWVRRAGIICQVGANDRLDRSLLAHAIDANLDGSTLAAPPLSPYGSDFFIRKGIGWALRDHSHVGPDWVRAFVDAREKTLSGLSKREALRHL